MTAATRMQKRRRGVAWLAILALLINALMPASLAAASAGQGSEAVTGWCGSGPAGHQPENGSTPPVCNHCILCSVASGFAPTMAGVRASALLATAILGDIAPAAPPFLSAHNAAQPRGPPAAAQI